MLCCSIGVFLLSQLYAGLLGLRALFLGDCDDFDRQSRSGRGTAVLAFSRPRFAVAMMIGIAGLSVALAVANTAAAHATTWMPILSSICRGLAS